MIDRSKLQTGDVLVIINPGNDIVDNLISWFSWLFSKSPEGSHIATVFTDEVGAEQYYPQSRFYDYNTYDYRFDQGQVVILRHKLMTPDKQIIFKKWVHDHMNVPYNTFKGLGNFAKEGILDRIFQGDSAYTKALKAKDFSSNEYLSKNVCSQWNWLGLSYSMGFDFAKPYGIGEGKIVPGDYLTMINDKDFSIVQSNNLVFQVGRSNFRI